MECGRRLRRRYIPWSAQLLLLHLLGMAVGNPCGPALLVVVEVGGVEGPIGLSRTLDSGDTEARHCSIVNGGWDGNIVLGCDEGRLNASSDGCVPRACPPSLATSVRLGTTSVSIYPLAAMQTGDSEQRLCREADVLFKGSFWLHCDFGLLSVNTTGCSSQWEMAPEPPWRPRARHAAVTLSDGSVLLMGGLNEDGPLREVWQWSPEEGLPPLGEWQLLPEPPWTGRFGAAAVWQVAEHGEQVTLLGGNDGRDRSDVWRWLRQPSPIVVPLGSSEATGTQQQDCVLQEGVLTCKAEDGVSGRRWFLDSQLQRSLALHVEWRFNASSPETFALIALQLDSCRQTFQVSGAGVWSTVGCTGTDPPWAQKLQPQVFEFPFPPEPGQWQAVGLRLDRDLQSVTLVVDGTELQVPGGAVAIGGERCELGAGEEAAGSCSATDGAGNVTDMAIRAVELVVWPAASIEVRKLSVTAPPGYWQLLVDEAPWPGRTSHAVVALPDGDLLLMGGRGQSGLLHDVWRWTPQLCTIARNPDEAEAARFELDCRQPCVPSVPYGQWRHLGYATWSARQGHAAIASSQGVLVLGGRSAAGFLSDVWRWDSSPPVCSWGWNGQWTQLTQAAGWAPRQGHSVAGFFPAAGGILPGEAGSAGVETVIIVGGYGGEPEHAEVQETPVEQPIASQNDLWCSHAAAGSSTTSGGFSSWRRLISGAPFDARTQAAAAVAPSLGNYSMLFFGGYDRNSRFVQDVWRWTGEVATEDCVEAEEE